jgi:hypothetical protein
MADIQCSCGFVELADEMIADHFEQVFVPDDHRSGDGVLHVEVNRLACSCGLAVGTTEELDSHFLAVFTPGDAIGHDGKEHEADER